MANDKFLQSVEDIEVVSRASDESAIEEGRRRVADGEDIEKVALDLVLQQIARDGIGSDLKSLEGARDHTPLHKVADKHEKSVKVAINYAFARGRGALGKPPNAERAAKVVRQALLDVLPKTLLKVLIDGGEAGASLLNKQLRTAGDVPGHEFHGNQWVTVEGSYGDQQHGTVVAKSKLGHVEVIHSGSLVRYGARRKDGELVGTKSTLREAKELLRKPRNEQAFPSGYLSPDVSWKYKGLEFRTAKAPQTPKLVMEFDVSNDAAAEWAREHAAELADGISEQTKEAIQEAVARAQEEGDLDTLHDEILAAVGDEARAMLIARTESMMAANEGQRQLWDQATEEGLLTGDEKRVWIATSDACPQCEELDEETADLDGEYPGDGGDGPPLHPNCRCTEGIVS